MQYCPRADTIAAEVDHAHIYAKYSIRLQSPSPAQSLTWIINQDSRSETMDHNTFTSNLAVTMKNVEFNTSSNALIVQVLINQWTCHKMRLVLRCVFSCIKTFFYNFATQPHKLNILPTLHNYMSYTHFKLMGIRPCQFRQKIMKNHNYCIKMFWCR